MCVVHILAYVSVSACTCQESVHLSLEFQDVLQKSKTSSGKTNLILTIYCTSIIDNVSHSRIPTPLRPRFPSALCTGDAIRYKHVPHLRAVTPSLPLSQDIANAINTAARLLPLSGDEAILIMIMHLLDLAFYIIT